MKISSIQLQAFFQLSQDLNFTRAAENIHITQSAFSTRIIKLEEELETKLFIREKSNVRLTEAGEKLLRHCMKVKALEGEVLNELGVDGEQVGGVIRLGGFSSVMRSVAIPSLATLLKEHSQLGLETHTGELDELMELLKTGSVDFLITNKKAQAQSIESLLLGHEVNVLTETKEGCPKNIYLDHDSKDVTTSSYFSLKPGLKTGKTRMRYLDDVYGLIDGVRLGLGRAVLPRHLIQEEKEFSILYPKTALRVPVYLLFFKGLYQTKLERVVIDALVKGFKETFS